MTLDKADQVSHKLLQRGTDLSIEERKAIRLGIEALDRLKYLRKNKVIGIMPLPSETEEDK